MKRIGLSLAAVLVALASLFSFTSPAQAAPTWEGYGTVNRPYLIQSCRDLYQIGQWVYSDREIYGNKNFRQTTHINCSEWDNNAEPFLPIGYGDYYFSGKYDGQSYEISGVQINASGMQWGYAGLFGYVDGGELVNIRITNGAVAGEAQADGNIQAGLLLGYGVMTRIENVSAQGTVDVTSEASANSLSIVAGGLAGSVVYEDLNNAYSDVTLDVTSSSSSTEFSHMIYAGGLVGQLYAADTENTYSKGTITVTGGKQTFVGGLAGSFVFESGQGGSIENSFSAISSLDSSTAIASPLLNQGSFIGSRGANTAIINSYALEIDGFDLTESSDNEGITGIDNDDPGIGYFYDTGNSPMDTWCFEESEACPNVIWNTGIENTPVLGETVSATPAYMIGSVSDAADDSPISNASLEVNCADNGYYTIAQTGEDGSYEFGVAELDEGMDGVGCQDGDTLSLRASSEGYNSVSVVLDESIDLGDGNFEDYATTLLSELPEQNFELMGPAAIENQGPNEGDANNDEELDSEQDNVHSFVNPVTGEYSVLEVSEGCFILETGIEEEEVKNEQDENYDYPAGIMDFEIECEGAGFNATVKQYYYGVTGDFTTRKYNQNTDTYFTIDGASITNETIGGQQAMVTTYQVIDGGPLDMNGEEDGYIIDPAGLGVNLTSNSGGSSDQSGDSESDLASTGDNSALLLAASVVTLGLGAFGIIYTRKTALN